MNRGLAEDVSHILCKREKQAWFRGEDPSGILVSSTTNLFTARKRIYLKWTSSLEDISTFGAVLKEYVCQKQERISTRMKC